MLDWNSEKIKSYLCFNEYNFSLELSQIINFAHNLISTYLIYIVYLVISHQLSISFD
jgi:hypothetical protein